MSSDDKQMTDAVRRDWFGCRRRREAREQAERAARQAERDAWMAFWALMHASMPKSNLPDLRADGGAQ